MKRLYILTGASGTGKSTVLNILKQKGYPVAEEAARKIISEEQAKPEGIQRNDPYFSIFLAKKQIEKEEKLPDETCFLDRSIIDSVAYALFGKFGKKEVPKELEELIKSAPYEHQVFYFEMPPKEIYGTTGETFESYENSLVIHKLIKKAYQERGYELIHVPFKPFEEQADLIIDYVKNH